MVKEVRTIEQIRAYAKEKSKEGGEIIQGFTDEQLLTYVKEGAVNSDEWDKIFGMCMFLVFMDMVEINIEPLSEKPC